MGRQTGSVACSIHCSLDFDVFDVRVSKLFSTADGAKITLEDHNSNSYTATTSSHPIKTAVSIQQTKPLHPVQMDPILGPTLRTSMPAILHIDLNTPEVQLYVVEHIGKSNESAMKLPTQLRAFPGRSHRPESDYDTWLSGVLLLKYPGASDLQSLCKIFDSFFTTCSL